LWHPPKQNQVDGEKSQDFLLDFSHKMQYLVFEDQPQVDCFQSLETVLSAKDAKPLPFLFHYLQISRLSQAILPSECLSVNYLNSNLDSHTKLTDRQMLWNKCFGGSLTLEQIK